MYINSINYFRGIAIIFIVFGHCFGVADFIYTSIAGKTILNLTRGGTSFFVFISGFLFHHIFYEKFKFKPFLTKKIKFVLLPYLILATIPIAYLLLRIGISFMYSSSSVILQYETLLSFPILKHYFTGVDTGFKGYWYIPFIMVVFAISPIYIRFIKLSLKTQILVALFLLICAVLIHRGTYTSPLSVFQNVFFYTPVYLFGILASEKKDIIFTRFTGKEFYILLVLISISSIQAYLGILGNYTKDPFTFGGIDLMLIQKLLFCFFFMIFLNRFENHKFRILEIIAANSFGIYFLHGIIIWVIEMVKSKLNFYFTSNSFLIYCMVSFLVFFLSLVATLSIKRILPKYSRYLVGS